MKNKFNYVILVSFAFYIISATAQGYKNPIISHSEVPNKAPADFEYLPMTN